MLLHCWCLVNAETGGLSVHVLRTPCKLQPLTVRASLYSEPHMKSACVFNCNLPPALLAEWPDLFPTAAVTWGGLDTEITGRSSCGLPILGVVYIKFKPGVGQNAFCTTMRGNWFVIVVLAFFKSFFLNQQPEWNGWFWCLELTACWSGKHFTVCLLLDLSWKLTVPSSFEPLRFMYCHCLFVCFFDVWLICKLYVNYM